MFKYHFVGRSLANFFKSCSRVIKYELNSSNSTSYSHQILLINNYINSLNEHAFNLRIVD